MFGDEKEGLRLRAKKDGGCTELVLLEQVIRCTVSGQTQMDNHFKYYVFIIFAILLLLSFQSTAQEANKLQTWGRTEVTI